jgi:hypothetical protein
MTVFVVPIEPIDTRYTRQWYEHIPRLLDGIGVPEVMVINGEEVPPTPTPGAFLDFGATNIYKSSQLAAIADLFRDNMVKPGDKFLYTDAWNPTVIQLKYMSSLLDIPVEIHGMWHAGSYDPNDFLGRLVGNEPWVRNSESGMFYSYDVNWFATDYHLRLFLGEVFNDGGSLEGWNRHHLNKTGRVALTGWPMDYLYEILPPYARTAKKPQIVFPHRLAPEKQLEIFEDLAASMPQYEWIVCQKQKLTKGEYHTILGESAMVFSANLQETYGISMIEGLICGAMPMVPDRLSYTEMYDTPFKYPSDWTKDWDSYLSNKKKLIALIDQNMKKLVDRDNQLMIDMGNQLNKLHGFTHADPLIKQLAGKV